MADQRLLVILSLGAGTQSTTLALMAAAGLITPAPDCAIFADTGEELRATYDHLVWLTGCDLVPLPDGRVHAKAGTWQGGVLPFPTHVAQAWAGNGKPSIRGTLGDEVLAATRGDGKGGSHSRPPFFLRNPDGTGGIIRRQCTGDYKIDVIQSKERELLGLRRGQRWPHEIRIEQWIGISTDEATRMAPVRQRRKVKGSKETILVPHPSIRARWPLIEAGMSRGACERWLVTHGYAIPPKSACTFCPFHSDEEWRRVKADPAAWARVVDLDRGIRTGLAVKVLIGGLYLHRSLKPIDEVDFSEPASKRDQLNLFENDCEGMCGL